MSTHSYIGVIEEDGTLKYVYCHSDGYPSYLGRMLLTYYNTPELATGLVNLGDLSMVRSMVLDALPPLTEWDSRSLQQKMVGGFSSQSR